MIEAASYLDCPVQFQEITAGIEFRNKVQVSYQYVYSEKSCHAGRILIDKRIDESAIEIKCTVYLICGMIR